MNSVQIVGRIGNDVELQKTAGGTSAVRLSIAVNGKDETTHWFNAQAYGKTADLIHQYFLMGDRIGIEGRLYTETYKNKDGVKVTVVKIGISNVTFIEAKGDRQTKTATAEENRYPQTPTNPDKFGAKPTTVNNEPLLDISADDLPF